MTYREVWRLARTPARKGGYDMPRDVGRAWVDLARATGWLIRPALRVAVLGYDQPSAVRWED